MPKLFAALLACALCLGGVAQAQNSPAAQRVFNKARAASGGEGWNAVRGFHEVGQQAGGPYERWVDPVRYGMRTQTDGAGGKLVEGYNGAGAWRIPASGVAAAVEPAKVAQVRSDAFFAAYGYFYPSRFDVRSVHLGARQSQGRPFEVVRVHPAGGQSRELWFDRRTGLLGLIVSDAEPRLTVELSDYRRIGPVMIPFRTVTYGGGLASSVERQLETIAFEPVDRALFSLPRPEEPTPAPAPATP